MATEHTSSPISLASSTARAIFAAIFATLILFFGGNRASAQNAYPNGAYAYGTVTQTSTFDSGTEFMFVVNGTTDAGTSGSTAFFINLTTTNANNRVANIMAAAAAGESVAVWNYGAPVSYDGQSGYASEMESVSW